MIDDVDLSKSVRITFACPSCGSERKPKGFLIFTQEKRLGFEFKCCGAEFVAFLTLEQLEKQMQDVPTAPIQPGIESQVKH